MYKAIFGLLDRVEWFDSDLKSVSGLKSGVGYGSGVLKDGSLGGVGYDSVDSLDGRFYDLVLPIHYK